MKIEIEKLIFAVEKEIASLFVKIQKNPKSLIHDKKFIELLNFLLLLLGKYNKITN